MKINQIIGQTLTRKGLNILGALILEKKLKGYYAYKSIYLITSTKNDEIDIESKEIKL